MHFKINPFLGIIMMVFASCGTNQNQHENQSNDFASCALQEVANKNYNDALHCINQAITVQSKNYDLYTTKVNILLMNQQYDTCLVFLKQLHQIKPNNSEAYSFEGYINEKLGNTALADENYRKAINACKVRVKKEEEEFKNKVNIAFLKFFVDGRVASLNYMDSLVLRHPGNGFILDKREFLKTFNKQKFIEEL